MTTPPIEPVTQEDREAVKWFQEQSLRWVHAALLNLEKSDVLGDKQDDSHPIYQAFARHRVACTMPAPSQHSALADKIESNLDYLQNHEYNPFEPDNQSQAFFVVCELSKQLAPVLEAIRRGPDTARTAALEEAAKAAFKFAVDVNALLTPLKSEWQQAGFWTEYDEMVFQSRPKVTMALEAALTNKPPNVSQEGEG
jgi:hypothetical protein